MPDLTYQTADGVTVTLAYRRYVDHIYRPHAVTVEAIGQALQ